jgi:hypothetical protein
MPRLTKAQMAIDTDKIVAAAAEAKAQLDAWTAIYEQAKEQLSAAHRNGLVPTKFAQAGFTFMLKEGKRTVVYPESVKLEIAQIQNKAKEAGLAEEKIGSPYWELRQVKG